MTERLRTKLWSVLTQAGISIELSEAETDKYPYVTYEMTVNPIRDKDGIRGYSGITVVRAISDDFDEADGLADEVIEVIGDTMMDATFSSRLTAVEKDCVNGVWTIELNYTLRQFE